MIKKKTSEKSLSDKDKKDWKNFVNSTSEIPNKDNLENTKTLQSKRFRFDFHGYSIQNANNKISEIINTCYEKGISEILIITGKGLHSKSGSNVYISEEFSKLKNTIPDFIKNNPEINAKVKIIKQADKNLGGSGAILIKLKRIIK